MFSQKKPYSAVTVQIERLTGEAYEENDFSGIVDLIEVIRIQSTGPVEAARALRKKLKYGTVHRQLRALTILDGLIQNAGPRFQRAFADEALLERLRVAATDPVSDVDVREKCKALFAQWAASYKDTPGMDRIVALYRQLPQRKKPRPQQQQQSKVLQETEAAAEDEEPRSRSSPPNGISGVAGSAPAPASASSSSSRPVTLSTAPNLSSSSKATTTLKSSRKDKHRSKQFNLEKEKPQLLQCIASSSVASTNLLNALKLINRENKQVSEDPEVMRRFETCKQLRGQILRYIQHVESEQWLGSLIHANEELVNALMTFEVLDKSVEYDSDSEDEEWDADDNASRTAIKSPAPTPEAALSGLSISGNNTDANAPPKPPRPGMNIPMPPPAHPKVTDPSGNTRSKDESSDEEDENDPFADRHAAPTPHVEASGMTWREV